MCKETSHLIFYEITMKADSPISLETKSDLCAKKTNLSTQIKKCRLCPKTTPQHCWAQLFLSVSLTCIVSGCSVMSQEESHLRPLLTPALQHLDNSLVVANHTLWERKRPIRNKGCKLGGKDPFWSDVPLHLYTTVALTHTKLLFLYFFQMVWRIFTVFSTQWKHIRAVKF